MLRELPSAFLYPVSGANGFVFLFASVLYGSFHVIAGVPTGFAIASYCVAFYYLAFHLRGVVTSTADGDDDAPSWPSVADMGHFRATAKELSFLIFLGFPAITFVLFDLGYTKSAWALGAATFLYAPLGLLASSLLDENLALNPRVIGQALRVAPLDYLVLVIAIALPMSVAIAAGMFSAGSLLLGALLAIPTALYALLFMARATGLFYRIHRADIGWD